MYKYFFMNHDDISNFILDNLELYLIVTILLIIWVIKSAKKIILIDLQVEEKKILMT